MVRANRGFRGYRRKRGFRRNKGTWFPINGTTFTNGGFAWTDVGFSFNTGTVPDDRSDGPNQTVFPVTRDITQFSNTAVDLTGPSLRDIVEGNDWMLQRIVGECHLKCTESNTTVDNSTWPNIEIAAGFFVARINDNDETLPDLTFDEIDPLQVRNAQNPWIWRRSWILQRPLASNQGFPASPCSNMEFGSAESGSHIDSKVKRRIRREERLWFVVGTIGWDGVITAFDNHEGFNQPSVHGHLDIRIFGGMRRGKNASSF